MERKTVSRWKKLMRRLIALALAAVIILPGLPVSGMLGFGMVEAKADDNPEPGNPDVPVAPGYEIRIYAGGGTLTGGDISKMECYTGPNGDGIEITVYFLYSSDEPVITLPTASKTNDEFLGWLYRDNSTNGWTDYSGNSFKLTKDIEFMPKWKSENYNHEPKYRLELIVWGGGSISNIGEGWTTIPLEGYNAISYMFESDEEKEITLPIPTKEGDVFDAWYLRDENNTRWAQKYNGNKFTLTDNTIMDARWKMDDAPEIRLFTEGGVIDNKDNKWKLYSWTRDDGSTGTRYEMKALVESMITLPTPVKEGYKFIGWQKWDDSAGTWVDYTGSTYKLTESCTLYAKYDDGRKTLTLYTAGGYIDNKDNKWEFITWTNDNGGTETEYSMKALDEPLITLPTPTKENCTFLGWQTYDESKDQFVDYPSTTYKLTESCTLYANFKDNRPELTLYTDGGVIDNKDNKWEFWEGPNGEGHIITVYSLRASGEPEITLPTPVKEGYVFKGWVVMEESSEWWQYTEKTFKLTKDTNMGAWFVKPATGLVLDSTSLSVEEGKTVTLDGDFTPEDQTEYPLVTWTSSDETIATVSDRGVITGIKEGTVTITASATGVKGDITATCTVTVTPKITHVTEVRLSASSMTVKKGETKTLSANVLPADATDPSVTWTTGDSTVATVKDGAVTGVNVGTTAITAKADNITAAVIVTVTEDAPANEETDADLTDLIKDTGDGENLGDVIKDVVSTTTDASGKTNTETKIWIGGLDSSYKYTGDQIKPAIHVYDGVKKLAEKTDYTVKYKNNKDAGTNAGIEIKFKGNYAGTPDQTVTFTIDKAVFKDTFTASDIALQATGKELKPAPVVKWKSTGKKLNAKAYKVTYDGDKDSISSAGKHTATITATDPNFEGSITINVNIIDKKDKNRDLSKGKIKLGGDQKTWTGKEITYVANDISVTDSEGKTVDKQFYTVSYVNNINPGKATLIVTANDSRANGYVGSNSVTFTISKGKTDKNLEITVAATAEYDPKGAKPAITVIDKDTNTVLKEGTDYKVSYKENKKAGATAMATIAGKGNYKFSSDKIFNVTAKDVAELSVSATDVFAAKNWNKSKLTITHNGKKLNSKDYKITGYYSTDGSVLTSAPAEGSVIRIGIEGVGPNYKGTTKADYRLVTSSQDISKAKEVKKLPDKIFTGDKVTLTDSDFKDVLRLGDKDLVAGINFKIAGYEKNDKTGTAKVTIVGIDSTDADGNPVIMAGSKTLKFKITGKKGSWKANGAALINGEWKN